MAFWKNTDRLAGSEMDFDFSQHYPRTGFLLIVAVVLFSSEAYAQFETKWLDSGSFQHRYSASGAEPATDFEGLRWPGLYTGQDQNVMRAMWIGVRSHTDREGTTYAPRVVHAGPRTPGVGEVFPMRFETVRRYEKPAVTVDGFQSFDNFTVVNEIDASIEPSEVIVDSVNTLLGVTMTRKIMQFSQGYHDNYHITEYTFTNTGNADDDEETELPEQILEGVYFFLLDGYYTNAQAAQTLPAGQAWGKFQMFDIVGDGMGDYDQDFSGLRANFSWLGYTPGVTEYNPIGAPVWNDGPADIVEGDSTGRLSAPQFIGRVTLHADKSATDESDDPNQPTTTAHISQDRDITQSNSPFDEQQMRIEYDFMSQGHRYPHHADLINQPQGGMSWQERMATGQNDPSQGIAGGYNNSTAYGPYTLEPGQTVRFVTAEGSAGLSRLASVEIGEAYKESGADDALQIAFDADGSGSIEADEEMTKNMWVMTGRDSLFKTFRRAIANYESGYNIPTPPKPPKAFRVISGPDKITLEWELFSDVTPAGFEIYRGRNRYQGAVEDKFQYEKIAELGSDRRTYEDDGVQRGISYFYYLQAVGEVNSDPTGKTPTGVPLKSNRYYTQTYDPAFLKRPPGSTLEEAEVVPNPYNLASAQNIRWPDQQDKLAFLDIPGESTIKIYSELGELIETIKHTDGSGDAYWDLTTTSNQVVASGIYIAVIKDEETGDQVIRKFTIIR